MGGGGGPQWKEEGLLQKQRDAFQKGRKKLGHLFALLIYAHLYSPFASPPIFDTTQSRSGQMTDLKNVNFYFHKNTEMPAESVALDTI